MKGFSMYHPLVNFLYFAAVTGFSMFLSHPVCLAISCVCAFCYLAVLKGSAAKRSLIYLIPVIVFTAVLNPAFSHEGITVLAYLPSGNPLTLESVYFGLCAALMLVCVIFWFSCFSVVMTGDKLMWLLGRIIPSLSLVFSMVLRFVPRFISQLKIIASTQKCLGKDASKGGVRQRLSDAFSIVSVMITWALENSVETADSMKARGYGLSGRTSFSLFRMGSRDIAALAAVIVLSAYVLAGILADAVYFRFYPSVKFAPFSLYGISVILCFALLCAIPLIIEIWEVTRWKVLKSKI